MTFKPSTDKKWIEYHATRLNLIDSINSHLKSCSKINVYNNGSRTDIPLNTSGDYTLFNESMSVYKMQLIEVQITYYTLYYMSYVMQFLIYLITNLAL